MNGLARILLVASFALGFGRLSAADSMNMSGDMKEEILTAYVKVSSALAADDLPAAKQAAAEVAEHAKMSGSYKAIAPKADAVAKAGKIAASREAFKSLSAAVEPLAKGTKSYVVMYCPMEKADWVQTANGVLNPYYGKAMLGCGGPKETK